MIDDRTTHARVALEEVCARGDLERARELYAEDFVDHVNALEFRGQQGIAESVGLYRAIFDDLTIEVVDQFAEGERVVSRWTLRGTHRGRAVELRGITISRFTEGRIAEDWTVSDQLALLRQLGVWRGLAIAARYFTGRLRRPRETRDPRGLVGSGRRPGDTWLRVRGPRHRASRRGQDAGADCARRRAQR